MRYKLIAIDMDGTLLDDNHQVPLKNKETITRFAKQGINFILASGRPYQSLYPYTNELEVYLPLVSANGSIVKCPLTESIYHKSDLPYDLAKEILAYARDNDFSASIYFEDDIITSSQELADVHFELEGLEVELDENYKLNHPPVKIVIFGEADSITRVYSDLADRYENRLYVTRSDDRCVEVMNLEVSKGNALKYMMDRMNIDPEEVIAIGNQFNDLAMFEVAGLAIAMGNSPQGVKDAADFVTKSNEDNGVAYALEKFLA